MAEDWIYVFGKETMDEMSLSLVKILACYDSSFKKDRLEFAAHLGITPKGAEYLDGYSGRDDSAIDLISNDQSDDDSSDSLDPTLASSTSLRVKDNDKQLRMFCAIKDESMKEFLGTITDLQRARLYHRWNSLSSPLFTPRKITEKKRLYGLLNVLIITVHNPTIFHSG
jgi:hypothetical protein